jgi:hypothetical protein
MLHQTTPATQRTDFFVTLEYETNTIQSILLFFLQVTAVVFCIGGVVFRLLRFNNSCDIFHSKSRRFSPENVKLHFARGFIIDRELFFFFTTIRYNESIFESLQRIWIRKLSLISHLCWWEQKKNFQSVIWVCFAEKRSKILRYLHVHSFAKVTERTTSKAEKLKTSLCRESFGCKIRNEILNEPSALLSDVW